MNSIARRPGADRTRSRRPASGPPMSANGL